MAHFRRIYRLAGATLIVSMVLYVVVVEILVRCAR